MYIQGIVIYFTNTSQFFLSVFEHGCSILAILKLFFSRMELAVTFNSFKTFNSLLSGKSLK